MSSTVSSSTRFPWGITAIAVAAVGVAVVALPRLTGAFSSSPTTSLLTHEAQQEELLITVTEEGNVESASNVDVKCQVAGGSSILWIIPDGEEAKEGDKLVELDSSALEDQINQQKITLEKARATKLQAEKAFEVAKIAITEYLEGTFQQSLQDADAAITIAEENLRGSKNAHVHAEKMFRKGYVSELDMEAAKFAVERCELELGSAKTARNVLVKFTKEKTLQELYSTRDNAEAQMRSDGAAFDLEESKLKRLEDQLKNCTIYAPQDGMVVYANERGGRFGQTSATIEEGAAVRERQTILRLPDLEQMQVKVAVHESKVDQIEPGMRARIRILDRELTGTVTSIANQPEPSSFFSGNVKEYATYVRINETGSDALRPGMTAEVEILVAHLKDVVTVPVAAVVEQRGSYLAWVMKDASPEKRPLVVGLSDDQFVEIKDGVLVGDKVLLNPRAAVEEARKIAAEEPVDVNKRFGAQGEPVAEGGPGRRAGGPGGRSGGGGGRQGGPGARAGGGGGRPGGPGGRAGGGGGGPQGGGPGGRAAGGRQGGAGGGGGGGGGGDFFARLDGDGDGKIGKDEARGPLQSNFDSIDTDGDGFISKSELTAAGRRAAAGRAGGGGRPGGGRPNAGGE